MVLSLRPGKFYGSSLPRPRFYADFKYNDHRVDPPPSVMDPLLNWAQDAHWSMGGLSFTRTRLQGRIEGNVDKLRAQRDKKQIHENTNSSPKQKKSSSRINKTPSPPPPPVAIKRRRVVGLVDEDDEDEEEEEFGVKRRLVRKLGDDFERVARESGMALKTRSKRSYAADDDDENIKKRGKKLVKIGNRSSPRLAKKIGGAK